MSARTNHFEFRKREGVLEGYKYSCYYDMLDHKDPNKYFTFYSSELKSALHDGIIKGPFPIDMRWLKDMLHTEYNGENEKDCVLLKNMAILEKNLRSKFAKEYFYKIETIMCKKMVGKDHNGKPYFDFDEDKFKDLANCGFFNNLKVKISGLEKKVELNEKEGFIKGYYNKPGTKNSEYDVCKRFKVEVEGKIYLIKRYNLNYNGDLLFGEQKSIFGRYIKKLSKDGITYPTKISFRLSNTNSNWKTEYKNMCTLDVIDRDDDILRDWLRNYKFKIKFTPRIHYKIIDCRIFVNIELLLLELKFYEKLENPQVSLTQFIDISDEDVLGFSSDTEDED